MSTLNQNLHGAGQIPTAGGRADLVINDVDQASGEATVADVQALGRQAIFLAANVVDWKARGHEVGAHIDDTAEMVRPTYAGMDAAYTNNLADFATRYQTTAGPTVRHHSVVWYGWADAAEISSDPLSGISFRL